MSLNKLRKDFCLEDSSLLRLLTCIDVSEKSIAATFGVEKTKQSDNFTLQMEAIWWPRNWLDDQGIVVEFSAENNKFFSVLEGSASVQTGPGAHPTLLYNGYSGLFLLG